jgi:hypothetical protein
MHSLAEWNATIPDELTLRDALVYVEMALADAKEATDSIVAKYTGGTLPPPPWPQPDSLVTAIKQMEGGRILIRGGIEQGHGDEKFKKTDVRAMPLLNAGRNIYREIAAMLKADKEGEIKLENAPKLAARGAKSLFAMASDSPIVALAMVAGVIWLVNEFDKGER